MKTRKRDLERAYDKLSNALDTLATTELTASRDGYATKEIGRQHVDGMVAAVRQLGAELITLTENAGGRCSAELIGMCENLIDRSATVLTITLSKEQTMEVAIWSREHHAYWAPNRCGYTRSLDAAGRYSLEDAVAICDRANMGLRDNAPPEETIRPINQGAN